MSLEALERPVSARYLSLGERERIADLLTRKESLRTIAGDLGRSPSSISREIKRNSHPTLGHQPYSAHRTATAARARPKNSKLAAAAELLIKNFPDDEQMRVSRETIYQAPYFQDQDSGHGRVKGFRVP